MKLNGLGLLLPVQKFFKEEESRKEVNGAYKLQLLFLGTLHGIWLSIQVALFIEFKNRP